MISSAKVTEVALVEAGASMIGVVDRECSGVAPVEGGSYLRKDRLTGRAAAGRVSLR